MSNTDETLTSLIPRQESELTSKRKRSDEDIAQGNGQVKMVAENNTSSHSDYVSDSQSIQDAFLLLLR